MTRVSIRRSSPVLLMAAMTAIPAASAWSPTPTLAAVSHKSKAVTHTYKGPEVDMRWGPVQATIKVKGKKIASVSIATSPENERSLFIDQQAVPDLRTETLQAQSSQIDGVSGATMTSDAYIESLQAAIKKAHLPTT